MIRRDGQRWVIDGAVTIDTLPAWRTDGAFDGPPPAEVDWSALTAADSAALSLMLSWQREAAASGVSLRHVNVGPNLRTLAEVYGVRELLALDPS